MTNRLRWCWWLCVCTIYVQGDVFAQSFKSESDLRRQAEKDFKNEDYAAALPLYSQLLSLNQKDAKLNYHYGVCLLMADKDKTSSYNFLQFASHDSKTDDNVYFYMGKALQLSYRFDEAVNAYNEFIKKGGISAAGKFDTQHQIETCNNAKELMKSRVNITVKSSKEVSPGALYSAYDAANSGGKLLATSYRFLSTVDTKKIKMPMMFLTADGQTIYFASYGKNEDNGKDIYVVHKLASGEWGLPQNLGTAVNTKYDEDYPFLDADGRTLYFSSKGHNSMGGYDIFKTMLDAGTGEWSEPVNLGAGINSPDDDFFYMPVADDEAQFSSTKETAKGMVMVYRIEVAASQNVLATIHGVYKSVDQVRADGKISILRKSDKGLVSTARTDQKTGAYELSLPVGDDYEIVVEGGGYMAHVENFSLPAADRPVTIVQHINMNRNKGDEELEIRNNFLQSDSNLIASLAEQEGTIVVKEQYPVGDSSKQNLQPFAVGGQVVYATPPSAKSIIEGTNTAALTTEQATDAVAMSGKEGEMNTSDNAVSRNVNSSIANSKGTKGTAQNKNKISKDRTNISDEEAVKIAFSDAQDLDAEAKDLADAAKESTAVAVAKDTIVALQLNQSIDALQAGDKGAAREFTRQAQLNADTAQQARSTAHELADKAKMKQAEADKALADAKELQKNTKKNVSGTVAMNKSKQENKNAESNEEKKNGGSVTEQQVTSQNGIATAASEKTTAGNDVKSPETQKQEEYAKQNTSADTLVSPSKANESQITAAKEETKVPATSEEATKRAGDLTLDSKNFDYQARELKDQIKDSKDKQQVKEWKKEVSAYKDSAKAKSKEADKEVALARYLKWKEKMTADSANESTGAFANNKNFSNQPKAGTTADATKENKKETGSTGTVNANPEQPATDELNGTSKGANQEKSSAIANKPDNAKQQTADKSAQTNKEIKDEITPAAKNTASNVEQPEAEKSGESENPTTNKEIKSETATAIASVVSSEEKKSTNATPEQSAKPDETIASSTGSEKSVQEKEKISNAPVNVAKETNRAEAMNLVPADNKSAELLKNIAPDAVSSYKEYLVAKNESDSQQKQSDDLQAGIAKMRSSAQRDRLIQKSNDLNLQSIKNWQEAEVSLNAAKEADPSVESKMKDIHFTGFNTYPKNNADVASSAPSSPSSGVAMNTQGGNDSVAVNKPNDDHFLSAEELKVAETKDSLVELAASHRLKAENAKDTATEKSELETTKDLIIQSSDPGKNLSSKAIAMNKGVKDKNLYIRANEDSENAGPPTANPESTKSESATGKEAIASAANETANTKTAVNDKSQNELVTNSSADKDGSSDAGESGSSAYNTDAALNAKTLHVDESAVFSFSPKQMYNSANPIPMDPQLPEGLVFKVQIGAFHNPLSPDAFKNVQPLSGETTRAGWIRYCVGLFRTFEPANMVKVEMRSAGYKDAFVVAYYNGKRISLFDAYAIINRSGNIEKKLYADASVKEMHHLNSLDIKPSGHEITSDNDVASFYGSSLNKPAADETSVEYAVQVGVYKTNVVPKKLQTLIPLNAESYRTSLYRFTTSHFSERIKADSMRLVAVNKGVKDAFVIKYKLTGNSAAALNNTKATKAGEANASSTAYGEMMFKVQIGAYRTDLSQAKLTALETQCSAILSQSISASGLHLIYAGSFKDYNLANALKNDIVNKGIKDAFIAAFSGDERITIDKTRK